jgi:hypothetical protein
MKARYIGYPGDAVDESPLYVTHLGVTFRRDRWANVPEGVTPLQLSKLQNHPHFEVAEGEAPELAEDEAEETAAAAASLEGATIGKPAASELDKAGVLARLNALKTKHPDAAIAFDPKWGKEKLAGVLEAAEFELGED